MWLKDKGGELKVREPPWCQEEYGVGRGMAQLQGNTSLDFGEVPKAPDFVDRKARFPGPLNQKVQMKPWSPMTALYPHFPDNETSSERNGNLPTGALRNRTSLKQLQTMTSSP